MNVFGSNVVCCCCKEVAPTNEASAYYGRHEDCYVDSHIGRLSTKRLFPVDVENVRSPLLDGNIRICRTPFFRKTYDE